MGIIIDCISFNFGDVRNSNESLNYLDSVSNIEMLIYRIILC